MREVGCVFFAASFAVSGSFLGKFPDQPNHGHAAATSLPQTRMGRPPTGAKRLPESS
jgi:hypothetical protein